MTTTNYDANAVLMGGASAPTWKFDAPGTRKVGTIAAPPVTRQEREYDPHNPGGGQLKFFPSGDPIMGIVVEVQTDERDPSRDGDDGRRTFYIEGKRLKDAVRTGVRNAGANGLEVGGVLDVTLTHYDVPNDRRSGRNWSVVYTPAGNAALMGDEPHPATQAATPTPAPAPAGGAPQMTPEQAAAFQAYLASKQQGA